jgi:hypothetical protein
LSLALTDFTVATAPRAVKVLSGPDGFGSFNTTPGGSRYLYLDTDIGLVGSSTTYSFNAPQRGFGFDYTGVNEPGNLFTVTINGQVFTLASNPNLSTASFWGYIPPTGSVQTALVATSNDSGYGIDQVTYRLLPEPAAIASLPCAMLALRRRRRSCT